MKLIALKEQVYGGRTIMAGETFEAASPMDARTLQAIKRAKPASEETAKPEKAEKAGTYRNRRLRADD